MAGCHGRQHEGGLGKEHAGDDVDQFYGIEIIQFPALIAETALWMMDHIMNDRLSMEFGKVYARIPLEKSPHIHVGNALETDWNDVLPARECSYVFGNPPFVGHQWRTKSQQADMARIWGKAGSRCTRAANPQTGRALNCRKVAIENLAT